MIRVFQALIWLGRAALLAIAAIVPAAVVAQPSPPAADCAEVARQRARDKASWDFIVVKPGGPIARNQTFKEGDTISLPAATIVRLCDRNGLLLAIKGPAPSTLILDRRLRAEERGGPPAASLDDPAPDDAGISVREAEERRGALEAKLAALEAERRAAQAEQRMPDQDAERARAEAQRRAELERSRGMSPPKAAAPTVRKPGSSVRGVRGSKFVVGTKPATPAYPVWPPEVPSSRASMDRYITKRSGMTLYDAGQRLIASFEDTGYLEHSFYSAPGGFVLVTRIEKIGEDGRALEGAERYRLPSQRSDPSMTDYIRNLFLEAPPGFYRYIAVVVSNEPYRTSERKLRDAEAVKRLRSGSSDLDRSYRSLPFTSEYKVDALIYEFRKDAKNGTARLIDPGRLPPATHLARTKLDSAIRKRFAK